MGSFSTSLRVGFGDSCDLGATSVRARWELNGAVPHGDVREFGVRCEEGEGTAWTRVEMGGR